MGWFGISLVWLSAPVAIAIPALLGIELVDGVACRPHRRHVSDQLKQPFQLELGPLSCSVRSLNVHCRCHLSICRSLRPARGLLQPPASVWRRWISVRCFLLLCDWPVVATSTLLC
ncbi:MAG: hypothetical protein CMN97_04185 [Synechococcus sp. NAT40]|nr:hypothetical protein [Synechococcus sp. NAT40]